MELSAHQVKQFNSTLLDYYKAHGRHDLPWRIPEPDGSFSPYKILLSEVMLQQTQVQRVIPKYQAFLAQFPTIDSLGTAPLGDVLKAWQGLGYNRRAKYLWLAAQQIHAGGVFPRGEKSLVALPGVGVNTAGAVLAYAYNQPSIFVETNIRTVILHHFTADDEIVSDTFVREVLGRVMRGQEPRQYYWALMDYGTHLKTVYGNIARRSAQYAKQTPFSGSLRQVRGAVLRVLSSEAHSREQLMSKIGDDRLATVLSDLIAEGLVRYSGGQYHL